MVKIYVPNLPGSRSFLLDRSYKKRLIKVMRLHPGDELLVFSSGKKWQCRLTQIHPEAVEVEILRELPVEHQRLKLTLGQSLIKGDRFEWLIEKVTELGVSEIYPLVTERTVVRPSNVTRKLERWNEIAEQAAGQSENPYSPVIHPPETIGDFAAMDFGSVKLLLHERDESAHIHDVIPRDADNITYVVGPEGGWTPEESTMLIEAGFRKVHLGSRILRGETAGLTMTAILQYERGGLAL